MSALPTRDRGQRGFTLVEMTVVVTLLSLVTFTLYGLLDSMSANATRQQALVIDQEDVRLGMVQITRDIRSSNPILPLATAPAFATQIDMAVLPANGSALTYVRWQLTGGNLNRIELSGPNGTVRSTKRVLTNVTNTATQPLFSYFTSTSSSTPVDLTTALPGDVANCTIRVHVRVIAASKPGPAPFTENTDAEIRNRLPGGIGC